MASSHHAQASSINPMKWLTSSNEEKPWRTQGLFNKNGLKSVRYNHCQALILRLCFILHFNRVLFFKKN
jgi:hypothetical protein